MPTKQLSARLYKTVAGQAAMMSWYDQMLATIPDCQSCWVTTRFGPTHVLVAGPTDAPPLILLHGANGNALMWKPQLVGLAQHYRLFAPDIIGMAGRSAATRPGYGGPAYVEWLVEVLDELALNRANFVGVSAGGWLIMKLAALDPNRIARSVLLSPAGFRPVLPNFKFVARTVRGSNLGLRYLFLTPANTRRLVQLFIPPGLPIREDTVEFFYLLMRYFKNQGPPPVLSPKIQTSLTAPTLLLMGQHEVLFNPRQVIATARRNLPNLQAAAILPNAGHGLNDDQADLVNQHILNFCGRV